MDTDCSCLRLASRHAPDVFFTCSSGVRDGCVCSNNAWAADAAACCGAAPAAKDVMRVLSSSPSLLLALASAGAGP
eukprot:6231354-Pyramimonas_sp.AAC.1